MSDLEEWIEIEGFPNYEISNYGEIFNLKKGLPMRIRYHVNGKRRVVLHRDGVGKEFYVHRLVAQHFLEGYRDGLLIRCKDGNYNNCHVSNLEVCGGNKEIKHLAYRPKYGGGRRVYVPEIDEVFLNARFAAEMLNTDASSIYKVLRGERKKHLGLTFQYFTQI